MALLRLDLFFTDTMKKFVIVVKVKTAAKAQVKKTEKVLGKTETIAMYQQSQRKVKIYKY